ncbi:chloride transporter [Cellulomonas carbonis T26]|uniref:Chloride transporter n=1 Tax=Cellulomonas carbonis T26 TaxID=947969 RepID=A0A0A0BVU5_9CELL|nr:chloride transporter [Cellulomonas carbonis T26]
MTGAGRARFGDLVARDVVDCVDLERDGDRVTEGFWAVVGEFDGPVRAWRFADVRRAGDAGPERDDDADDAGTGDGTGDAWHGPDASAWRTSLDAVAYRRGVEAVRRAVHEGDVYQVNLCRVLEAPLAQADQARGGPEPDAAALARRLRSANPAPYEGFVHVPAGCGSEPVWVVSASPELFLDVRDGWVSSGPIKGTAATPEGLLDKDRAENVMIADMVRNDLQQVCRPGTVEVTDLLGLERHPGLVHLVTTVRGRLLPGTGWSALLGATYPPASVSGAPKSSALRLIRELEPVPRGPYCGAVGWLDADAGRARLAVGIRTFWWTPERGGVLHFGTGAGITWGSDPDAEWAETELKARRLVGLATADGRPAGDAGDGGDGSGTVRTRSEERSTT